MSYIIAYLLLVLCIAAWGRYLVRNTARQQMKGGSNL